MAVPTEAGEHSADAGPWRRDGWCAAEAREFKLDGELHVVYSALVTRLTTQEGDAGQTLAHSSTQKR